ncbi:MAG: VTT domain-containing protein, partial [Planctomycetaceae bacterium]
REIVVRRLGSRGSGILESFQNHGAFYLFTLRMMPQAPFVLVNLVMSVSSIRASTFFWVSQIGMLPGTCLYVFAGSRLPSLKAALDGPVEGIVSGPLVVALILLGVFPLAVRIAWLRKLSANDRLVSPDS